MPVRVGVHAIVSTEPTVNSGWFRMPRWRHYQHLRDGPLHWTLVGTVSRRTPLCRIYLFCLDCFQEVLSTFRTGLLLCPLWGVAFDHPWAHSPPHHISRRFRNLRVPVIHGLVRPRSRSRFLQDFCPDDPGKDGV